MSFGLAVRVDDGVDVGTLLSDTLAELHMAHKEAWLTCGVDGASFSRSLRGEQPLDLWKLRHLPIRFWQAFLPRLASALIRQWFTDLETPYRMARAEIRRHEDKEKSA